MKKIMLISLLVLLLALACSCVEEIDAEIPELGPMQSATKPTTAKPAPGIDPDDIPDTPALAPVMTAIAESVTEDSDE